MTDPSRTQKFLADLKDFLLKLDALIPQLFPQPAYDQDPKTLPMNQETPKPITYDFSTPAQARHSVRVICDEMGLSVAEKNLICQVINAESGFNNNAKRENKKDGKVWSTDWGICQINDWYHVGPGKKWSSVRQILDNPEKVVRWMITLYRQGHLNWWVAYSSGAYKNYKA